MLRFVVIVQRSITPVALLIRKLLWDTWMLTGGQPMHRHNHFRRQHGPSCSDQQQHTRCMTTTVKRALQMLRSRNRTRARCARPHSGVRSGREPSICRHSLRLRFLSTLGACHSHSARGIERTCSPRTSARSPPFERRRSCSTRGPSRRRAAPASARQVLPARGCRRCRRD